MPAPLLSPCISARKASTIPVGVRCVCGGGGLGELGVQTLGELEMRFQVKLSPLSGPQSLTQTLGRLPLSVLREKRNQIWECPPCSKPEGKGDPSLQTWILTRWGNSELTYLTPLTASDRLSPDSQKELFYRDQSRGNDDN